MDKISNKNKTVNMNQLLRELEDLRKFNLNLMLNKFIRNQSKQKKKF